jgi:hypothetical protein
VKLKHISSSAVASRLAPDLGALFVESKSKRSTPPEDAFTTEDFASENKLSHGSAKTAISTLVRNGKVKRVGEFLVDGLRKFHFQKC